MFAHKGRSTKTVNVYSKEFQEMLDRLEAEDHEESKTSELEVPLRKKRLRNDQIKALEESFEVENKLEPERKVKIAEDLGIEPRQVAIWFQNRRARCKTKQLENEYSELEASYEALKRSLESLEQERISLLAQFKDLEAKLEAKRDSRRTEHASVSMDRFRLNPTVQSEVTTMDEWSLLSREESSHRTETPEFEYI
ncbi:hypothetical protein Drorol1_Dr00024791 [Drosera rotundifolia]